MATPAAPRPRRIVGVSTKMYFSAAKTKQYVDELLRELSQLDDPSSLSNVDIFVIPDHLTLASVIAQIASSPCPVPVLAGAQNAHHADAGAFTGEVSPAVLAELGARIVELGHAERRRLFAETDADASLKAAAAARHGLTPLVCVGEVERGDASAAAAEVRGQVESVLAAVPGSADVVLAYEPVWAIGAAEPAAAEHVVGVARRIREIPCVRDREGSTRIVYGGSAGPGLFEKLKDGLDGLFLGRFAHDPKQFRKTILEVAGA